MEALIQRKKYLPVAAIDRMGISSFLENTPQKPINEYTPEDLIIYSSSQIAHLPYHIIMELLVNPKTAEFVRSKIEEERLAIAKKHNLEGIETTDTEELFKLSGNNVLAIIQNHKISLRDRLVLAGRIQPINHDLYDESKSAYELTLRSILFFKTLEQTNYSKIEKGGDDALNFWEMIPKECRVKYFEEKENISSNPSFLEISPGLKLSFPDLFPQQQ